MDAIDYCAPPSAPVPVAELELRLGRARRLMATRGIDAIALTDQHNIEYFTGYLTLSWAYNARPVLALLTQDQLLVFAARTERRNIEQIARPFTPIYYDGFLREAVDALLAAWDPIRASGRSLAAVDYGQDMFGRGTLALVEGLRSSNAGVLEAADLLWEVRKIKTPFEAELKRISYKIVNGAFDAAIRDATIGMTELELCRLVQAQIVMRGAERFDPIAMLFSKGDFIYNRPAGTRKLEPGHTIWTDFRSYYGGYPADRNRIARAGAPTPWERAAYTKVRDLTLDLARGIRPGMTGGDVYRRFVHLWTAAGLGEVYGLASRIGHGGGMDITEPPSLAHASTETIEAGMILHIEPKLEQNGAVFQFEEVIHVGEASNDFLSELSPPEIPIIGA
jgi:Xaa-Pro aminopeptidase